MIHAVAIRGEPIAERAGCADCAHCQSSGGSWWCMSDEASSVRGTKIPGIILCDWWRPIRQARWWDRLNPFVVKHDMKLSREAWLGMRAEVMAKLATMVAAGRKVWPPLGREELAAGAL